jgi:hypothetical protein
MKLSLFLQWHQPKGCYRLAEYFYCLRRNLGSSYVSHVYLMIPSNEAFTIDGYEDLLPNRHKLRIYAVETDRISYRDWLRLVLDLPEINDGDIIGLINTDCFVLDSSLNDMFVALDPDMFLCISRHEYFEKGCLHEAPHLSQDAWITKYNHSKISLLADQANIKLGKPGCDNRIAYILRENGYNLVNPCLTVNISHVHRNRSREYTEKDRIYGSYCFVSPSNEYEYSPSLCQLVEFTEHGLGRLWKTQPVCAKMVL